MTPGLPRGAPARSHLSASAGAEQSTGLRVVSAAGDVRVALGVVCAAGDVMAKRRAAVPTAVARTTWRMTRLEGLESEAFVLQYAAMPVREMRPEEKAEVMAMMGELWQPVSDDFGDETVYVWERPEGGLGGFISFSVRPWAEGCESEPVPYVEGWYVAADLRRTGVGRALVEAVEGWCREQGHVELGSDAELHNDVSLRAHEALGFERTLRLQYFRKRLK